LADGINLDDPVYESHGVKVIVDPKSLPLLDGAPIDFARDGLNEGFQYDNPYAKRLCGCGESFGVRWASLGYLDPGYAPVVGHRLRWRLNFDHFEVGLGRTTVRAHPVLRYVFPPSTGRNAFLGKSFRFIVNKTAYHALPLFHAMP